MAELLPCPFCGEVPILLEMTEARGTFYRIKCNNSSCMLYVATPLYSERFMAITDWNTRIPQKINHNSLCETDTYKG
ncbi:MAG: Lar family restriction alleviation protein [Bacteroidaceae bacterium]|nr:Lar family restriction alleviation protein [Bacteroidaceae bacterium]